MAEKSAKKKPKKAAEANVLGNLSATRPTRLGGERRSTPTPTRAAAPPKKRATRTSPPKQADAKAAKLRKPDPAPPAGWQTPGADDRGKSGPPHGTELVTTAVQAAGELAQLGVTVGGRLLKRAAKRIPRP